jgi:hypothetical protein
MSEGLSRKQRSMLFRLPACSGPIALVVGALDFISRPIAMSRRRTPTFRRCIGVSATSCPAARSLREQRATVIKAIASKNEQRDLLMKPLSLSKGVPCRFPVSPPLGGYREGRSELPEFEPAVVVLSSSTISCTTLLSGSISMIRSGSFTNSSCFASGT